MLRFLIPAGLFAAPLLFSPQVSHAQTFGSSSSCPCTLHGTVVNSVSGQPVNRALVRLTAPVQRATLSDSEGKFQFEGLPAGLASFEADKPGFLTRDMTSAGSASSISVRLAPDSPPAILKITPEGVIFGQVSDERGEPLEGFTVGVLVRRPNGSQLDPYMPGRVLTDDEGKFRIPELRPGSYYLVVRQPQGAAPSSAANSSVPSGYPPVFYPGINDISSAVPLKLLPGKSVQANFSLKREPFVQISGTVSGYNPHDQINLNLEDSSAARENLEIAFEPASGSFHTKWIPPGSYTVTAQATNVVLPDSSDSPSQRIVGLSAVTFRGVSAHSYARQQVNAASSVSDLRLVLQPTSNISVLVRGLPAVQNPEVQQRAFFLALIAKDRDSSNPNHVAAWENLEDAQSSGDLRMVFHGVPPGTYELMMSQPNFLFYAESASSGAVDLLRENLVLNSSGAVPPINIVLRDDPATLNGTVSFGDMPVSGLVVLLSDKHSKPITMVTGYNGAYTIPGLAPGSYRVFAVDASLNFDFQDPALLQKVSSKIQEVTLASKQSATVNLQLARVDE